MAELIFLFNQVPTVIQCSEKDKFKVAVEKFANKVHMNSSNFYFLNDGTIKINLNQTIEEVFKKELNSKKKIQILVISNEEQLLKNNYKTSKEIICPKCFFPCLIEFKDYKATFSCCKNNHTIKDVSLSDYKNMQKIDESKIICDICKKQNKANTYENQFYLCLTCKKNVCPLCKSAHNKDHEFIDFEQYNFVCFTHNEKFSSYCKECKINLCMECESEHKDKQNLIYFRDIFPNKNKFEENLDVLKTKIEKYKEKINEIKKVLDNVIINLENYYEINDNLIKDFKKKKKNYYLFKNISEQDKNNNSIIKEINDIIKIDGFNDLINNSINIMNKMDIKYKGKNILPNIENISIVNNKNIIIDNFFSDINLVEDLSNIKKLYENFIKKDNKNSQNSNDNYEKLIYVTMLAEQCKNYEDMLYFMKCCIKNKNDILTSDERNLFSVACKQYISVNKEGNRTILAYENKERKKDNFNYLPYIIEYKKITETVCYFKYLKILKFIEDNIIKKDIFRDYDDEGKTFFYKMMGDYNRYFSEVETFKSKCINEADKYYNESLKFSSKLPIYNPVKLELILNLTIFYYEQLEDEKKAIDLAKSTIKKFDIEAKNLNKDDDNLKDSFDFYNLIKENLEAWENE